MNEEISLTDEVDWLRSNGLWTEGLSQADVHRRFTLFDKVSFGKGAWADESLFMRDLLPLEKHLATF